MAIELTSRLVWTLSIVRTSGFVPWTGSSFFFNGHRVLCNKGHVCPSNNTSINALVVVLGIILYSI